MSQMNLSFCRFLAFSVSSDCLSTRNEISLTLGGKGDVDFEASNLWKLVNPSRSFVVHQEPVPSPWLRQTKCDQDMPASPRLVNAEEIEIIVTLLFAWASFDKQMQFVDAGIS